MKKSSTDKPVTGKLRGPRKGSKRQTPVPVQVVKTARVTGKIDLDNFDFRLKNYVKSRVDYDISITVSRMKATTHYMMRFMKFFIEMGLQHKTVAAGIGPVGKNTVIVLEFDPKETAKDVDIVEITENAAGKTYIQDKRLVGTIIEGFGYAIPKNPNDSVKLFFTVHPLDIKGRSVYQLIPSDLEDEIV